MNFFGEYEDGYEECGMGFLIGSGNDIILFDMFKSMFLGGEYSYGSFSFDGMIMLRVECIICDYDCIEEEYLYRDRF